MGKNNRLLRRLTSLPIVAYQWLIRPLLRPSCRFYPSCSDYALVSIETHGVIRGLWFSCCRLFRCHPLAEGGCDPVKPAADASDFKTSNYEKF